MSDYSPLDDHAPSSPQQHPHQSKEEHSTSSYPSHPYSSGYGSSYTSYQNQSVSQVIEVSPPAAGGYSGYGEPSAGPSTFSSQEGGQRVSRYETSLSLRYDVEAALAYALGMFSGKLQGSALPIWLAVFLSARWLEGNLIRTQMPAKRAISVPTLSPSPSLPLCRGDTIVGAFLLVFERKNDYVRFHAWQSALFSVGAVLLLIVLALVSSFLYWVTLLATIGCLGYMARRAYIDGAIFERFALPYVGQIAMQFVDEE
ncbi:hypothetical protein DL89DRAFT_152558 [Linderina pennispora]|uniref:PRA1 family protein n=1 Tax=Linderina pennispora TaxID=61395 RepID=A0A1Y1WAF1_9FUNG|nr:uncharacterized protein DL89DRAFT_152558 [Linderina pennispora]ORX70124.1 hypothetical protein DL89DRAFT_152558 [Linderina pennispora]